jgi:hypothetical protein
MNNQEAKFILGAYRSDGRDAGDPMFAEALAQAERDPELRAWLEKQRKFDGAFSGRLRDVATPPGLREAILAGVRASQPRRQWWTNPMWLAAAAAIAIVATVSVSVVSFSAGPGVSELATFALNDLVNAHDDHVGRPAPLAGVQARLADARLPLTAELGIDLEDLRRKGCRSVRVAGREVFEICFKRDGTWYHLYAARRKDFAPDSVDAKSLVASRGEHTSATWADSKNVYALVTHAGQEAVRRLF